jgi:thioredoxin 1
MSNVINATDANFNEILKQNQSKHILVDFWAEWCGPCKMLAPVLDEISTERQDLVVIKVEIDQNPQTKVKFGVRSIPNLVLFSGGEELASRGGVLTKTALNNWIDSNLE